MDIFTKFKHVVKFREVLIDNEVFQLHYRVTALLLLGCAALVASKQHFGDPIDCITRDDVPNKIMDTYCWIHATFTLPSACNKTVGIEVPHPCVDKYSSDKEDRVYHKYYQWVYFVLAFQAACFYAPHLFWKSCESKRLRTLTIDLRNPLNKKVANLVNVIMQIYLVDEFLGGTFTTYGLDVLEYIQLDQDDRVDPMVRVFPRMTKCTFNRFGSSGDIQKYDALCILPLNIINEKIYIIMWFWFVFLAVVTGLWLIYRLFTLAQPAIRYKVIRRRANLADERHLNYVVKQFNTGDWFLMSMMCKNMDSQWYRSLVKKLSKRLSHEQNERKMNGLRGTTTRDVDDGRDYLETHSGKTPIIGRSDSESVNILTDQDDDDDDVEAREQFQVITEPISKGNSQATAAASSGRETKD